jgi:hypothetical protein
MAGAGGPEGLIIQAAERALAQTEMSQAVSASISVLGTCETRGVSLQVYAAIVAPPRRAVGSTRPGSCPPHALTLSLHAHVLR